MFGDFPTLKDPRHAEAYSPLWDAQLGLWTDKAVKQGLNKRQIDEVQVFNLAATRPDLLTGINPATGQPAPYGSVGVDINCAVIGFIDKAPTANLADPVAELAVPARASGPTEAAGPRPAASPPLHPKGALDEPSHLVVVALAAQRRSPRARPARAATRDRRRATTVATASSQLGRILVDGQGRTLYLFEKDPGPQQLHRRLRLYWPPLLTPRQADRARGAKQSLLGVIRRATARPRSPTPATRSTDSCRIRSRARRRPGPDVSAPSGTCSRPPARRSTTAAR